MQLKKDQAKSKKGQTERVKSGYFDGFLQETAKMLESEITGYIQSIYKVVGDTGLEGECDDIASMRLYKRADGV